METLRVTLLQTDIVWENIQENLHRLHDKLISLKNQTDIVILPEMFSTGFSMESETYAEPIDGNTITTLADYSSHFGMVLCGSFICVENAKYYNRAFFITPDKEVHFYDKRHLFRMGDEINHFSAGDNKLIVNYQGWNICLLVCYDLRFPVWSRNVNNEYDLLIYVANWPSSRRKVWDALLPARALENMAYVCAVNRIGVDGNDLSYDGGSIAYSPRGETLGKTPDNTESATTVDIDLKSLRKFREKFPAWKDADAFKLKMEN